MSVNKIDMKGKRFGKLKVVEDSLERTKSGCIKWKCKCDCGNFKNVDGRSLRNGSTQSCGCIQRARQSELAIERNSKLKGKRFGQLKVTEILSMDVYGRSYVTCICTCGESIKVRVDGLLNGHTKSCGCYKSELMKSRKGKNSPSYNFSITDEDRILKRTLNRDKLNSWRKNIFKRDDYKCVICGQNGYLHAHHLDGYHWCKDKRYDLNNGVTLCKEHHYTFHKKYGYKNNTKEQFEDYLKHAQ